MKPATVVTMYADVRFSVLSCEFAVRMLNSQLSEVVCVEGFPSTRVYVGSWQTAGLESSCSSVVPSRCTEYERVY